MNDHDDGDQNGGPQNGGPQNGGPGDEGRKPVVNRRGAGTGSTGLSPAQMAVRATSEPRRTAGSGTGTGDGDPYRQPHPGAGRAGGTGPANGLATASLVCGLIALLINPFLILGIVAIVLGINAKKRPGGHGMANAGIALGLVATVLAVLLMAFFLPRLQ